MWRIFVLSASAHLSFTHPVFLTARPVAILSQTFPRLCNPHLCLHLVWLHGSSSFLLLAWIAITWFFSILNLFFRCRSQHSIFHHRPIQWFATYFRQSLHTERANTSVPISSLAVLYVSVSLALILSRVFTVHVQLSLSEGKTANTWSTGRRHLIFHGMSLLLWSSTSWWSSQEWRMISGQIRGNWWSSSWSTKLAQGNCGRILQENIHDKIRDLWPPSRFLFKI